MRKSFTNRSGEYQTGETWVVKLGWYEIWTAITGTITLFIMMLGFIGSKNTLSPHILTFVQNNFWYVIWISGGLFVVLGIFLIVRKIIRHIIKQGLHHLEICYFARNASPNKPFGERAVRNIDTNQAYTVFCELDNMAKKNLIRWRTNPCDEMRKFLEIEGYKFHNQMPTKKELLEGTTTRGIKRLVWFYF